MKFIVSYIYGCHYAGECVYPNCNKCFFNGYCGYVVDNDYFSYFDDYYDLATEIQLQNGDKPFYSEYDGGFIL